ALLRAAQARGDLYAANGVRCGLANSAWLIVGQADEAGRQVAEARDNWAHVGYHVQHYHQLLALAQVDLYRGDGAGACQRLAEEWPKLARSLLLRVSAVRGEGPAL